MDANIIEDIWILGRFLKWIYRFIRRHTNYKTIIQDAMPLAEEVIVHILPFIQENKYYSQSNFLCLVYKGKNETEEEWNIILISTQYRYLTEVSQSVGTCDILKSLDKTLVYVSPIAINSDANSQ